MSSVATLLSGARFPGRDYVLIGGDKSPGKSIIHNGKIPSGWDERKGYALSGATIVPTGDPLATWAIEFQLWDPSDLVPWLLYYGKYFAPAVKLIAGSIVPRALSIEHPILSAAGMAECVVIERGFLEKDEYGLWSQMIFFEQYRKPKPVLASKPIVIPPAAVPVPTAEDAADLEIQKAAATLQSLTGP